MFTLISKHLGFFSLTLVWRTLRFGERPKTELHCLLDVSLVYKLGTKDAYLTVGHHWIASTPYDIGGDNGQDREGRGANRGSSDCPGLPGRPCPTGPGGDHHSGRER